MQRVKPREFESLRLFVDAGCKGRNGKIWDQVSFRVLREEPHRLTQVRYRQVAEQHIANSSNNVGEYLAIALAVQYVNRYAYLMNRFANRDVRATIYSDSQVALIWARNGMHNSGHVTPEILPLLQQANKDLLKATLSGRPLIYFAYHDNRRQGENPADYGRKGKKRSGDRVNMA